MIERWLKAQAIGLSAYAAGAFSVIPDGMAKRLRLSAMRRLVELLAEWGWESSEQMFQLPPNVLHVLAALDDNHITAPLKGRIQVVAHKALDSLTRAHDSPLAVAEILAHQIMNGSGPVTRVTRFAISLQRRKEAILAGLERSQRFNTFSAAVESLRARDSGTQQRIEAITQLAAVPGLPYSTQVRNLLLQHTFCWPLLVCSGAAISLPVAVDVDLTPSEGFRYWILRENHEAFDLQSTPADENGGRTATWLEHLLSARDAACLLWAKTHGNCGNFRRNVWLHQARFDFQWASRIARLAFGTDGREQLPLEGGSATACFAQTVLARLLGKRWYLSSAITGGIGPRVAIRLKENHSELPEDELDRDFWFERVNGVPEKFHYVRTTRSFERFVLPVGNESDIEAARGRQPGNNDGALNSGDFVEVAHQAKLSGVADVVQVEGWRKTHFIRCPEVADVIHGEGRKALPIAYGTEARTVQKRIAASRQCVLRLKARPAAVALAVAEINRLLHEQARQTIAKRESARAACASTLAQRRERGHLAPGLSWCVVRAVEEEQNAAFWRTLWRVIGAPLADFEWFRDSATREIAARRLAEALNRYAPVESAPSHRSPDIIIIVGLEKFVESEKTNETPLAQPLAVEPLLRGLDDRRLLKPSPYRRGLSYLQQLAGGVRFVLVPECNEDPVPQGDVELGEDEQQAMQALATFRFGFSNQMASLLLSECSLRGADVREQLIDLKDKGALRGVSGQYFMTNAMRRHLRRDVEEDDLAEANRQVAAGIALAPYTTAASVPGLAYDAAFLPENVKEAEVHFRQAYRLYSKMGDKQKRREIGRCFQRVCRFASVPDWGAVDQLNRARLGKDAYELAQELMAGWREHGGDAKLPPHPTYYVEAIEALMHWIVRDWSLDSVKRLYEDGLAACSAYPSEASYCEVQLASAYSVYLYRRHPSIEEEIRMADLRVMNHRSRWTSVRGDWFEKNGDCCADHREAAWQYLLGTRHAKDYRQNWVKRIGAGQLACVDYWWVLDRLNELDRAGAIEFCRSVASQPMIENQTKRGSRVLQRWMAALPILRESWGSVPECDQMLDNAISRNRTGRS